MKDVKDSELRDLACLTKKIGALQKKLTKDLKKEGEKIGMIVEVAVKVTVSRHDKSTEGGK